MDGKLKTTFIAICAALALVAPASAFAAAGNTQVTYKTELQETTPMSLPGYIAGTLKLTVASDGIVQGWYFPDYSGPAVAVSGSLENGQYWLSFGDGDFHINAAKQTNGTLVGSAQRLLPLSTTFPQTFDFVATPI
ncbi:MAG TPA: hypothetical protein VGW96_00350 [Candidatus Eremiobacteraceae bacterium]|jgi:hypothetical protein|nr:hypothetical protein [Candidatus Eremiobacteraceae bacterium]